VLPGNRRRAPARILDYREFMILGWIIRDDVDHPHLLRVKRRGLGIGLFQLLHPLGGLAENNVPLSEDHRPRRTTQDTGREPVIGDPVKAQIALDEHLGLLILARDIVGTGRSDVLERRIL